METPESKLIFLASRLQQSEGNPDSYRAEEMNALITQIRDWDKAVDMVIARQAGPLLYKKLSALPNIVLVPNNIMEALRQSQLKTLSRNMVLAAHFGQVANALNNENIPVIAMKGIYLSEWLYQDPSLRQCSDIDLLVKPADGERALEVLTKIGYQAIQIVESEFIKNNTETSHYPPMLKSGVSIEIHTKVHKFSSHYRVDLNTLWNRTETLQLHGVNTSVFCLTDQLITIAIHLEKHFDRGHFSFTGFFDLAWILTKHGSEIDWRDFEDKCEAWNTKSIFRLLYISHKYFGAPLPELLSDYKIDKHTIRIFEDCLITGSSTRNLAFQAENRIKNIDGVFNKIKYLLFHFIPAPSYMMKSYKLNSKWQLFYYYPYRFWCSVKAGEIYLINKIKYQFEESRNSKL